MVKKEMAIMIAYKDRPTELTMLLESLYYQTYQDFDVFIRDDVSGTPIENYHFLNCIINLLKCSGHKIIIKKNEFPHGVSKNRQALVDDVLEKDYTLGTRLDDDVILEQDYLERMIKVLEKGYLLASGVTPPMQSPLFKRDPKHVGEVINRVVLDNEGNYIFNGDDCGILYTESKILPAHHFRSSATYYMKIHKKVNYTPTKLTKHGFREEQIFSYKLQMEGYKIGIDTGAIAWHQMTPSGGERFPESNELIQQNQRILEEYTKENKDRLNKIFGQPELTKQELMKETNLAKVK